MEVYTCDSVSYVICRNLAFLMLDLETSEVLYFFLFCINQKNAPFNAKIRSISIITKTIVREKGIVNKLFKRRTILCILVFKSSFAFEEKLDGLQIWIMSSVYFLNIFITEFW